MSSGHFLSIFFPGGGKHFSSYYFFAISLQYLAFSCTVFLRFCIPLYYVAFIDMQTKLTLTSLPFTNHVSLIGGLEGCEVQLRLSQSPGLYKRPLFASDRESLIWGAFVGTAENRIQISGFFLWARCCIFFGLSIHGCAISVPKYLVCAFSFQIYFLWKGITLGLQKTL